MIFSTRAGVPPGREEEEVAAADASSGLVRLTGLESVELEDVDGRLLEDDDPPGPKRAAQLMLR
jgi:hypothetical protein